MGAVLFCGLWHTIGTAESGKKTLSLRSLNSKIISRRQYQKDQVTET
jgi:hypothetical protein